MNVRNRLIWKISLEDLKYGRNNKTLSKFKNKLSPIYMNMNHISLANIANLKTSEK